VFKRFGNLLDVIRKNKLLVTNFSHLSIFQAFNLLIPLITYPYLIKVLGSEKYGFLIFAQAIIGYFSILVNFGFNLSASKEVSIHRNNKPKLNEIISSVFILKSLLLILSLAILITFIHFGSYTTERSLILLISMHACIFDLIFPLWFFQGIEKMKYVTLINLISKTLFLSGLFLFIRSENDLLFVPIIQGFGSITAGFISIYFLLTKFGIKLSFQDFTVLKRYFNEGFTLFLSNFSIQVYTNANKLIIGSYLGFSEVAAYELAEKLVNLSKTPLSLISQTIFPKVSKQLNLRFVWNMAKITLFFNIIIVVILLLSGSTLMRIFNGDFSLDSLSALRILAVTVPIIGLSNFLGIQILVPFGYVKHFSKTIGYSVIFYLGLFVFFNLMFELNIRSIAMMTVLTEIYVTFKLFLVCKQKKLLWKNMII